MARSLATRNFGSLMCREKVHKVLLAVATCGLLCAFVALSCSYAETAELRDEELVLAAQVRLIATSHLPGRDFTSSAMPATLAVALAPMAAFGFSIDVARFLGSVLVGLGVIFTSIFVGRRSGRPWLGLTAGFLLVASPYWQSLCQRSLGDAAASAFLGLALWGSLAPRSIWLRAITLGAASGLAISCVPAAVVTAAPLALLLLFESSATARQKATALAIWVSVPLGIVAMQAALMGGPFLLACAVELPTASLRQMSVFDLLVSVWRWSPAPLLVFFIGAFGASRLLRQRRFDVLTLLAAAMASIVFELVRGTGNGDGAAFAMPVVGAAGLMALHATGDLVDNPLRFSVVIFPFIAFVYPVPPVAQIPQQLQAVRDATAALESAGVCPGLILSVVPSVASAAGCDIVPGTQLGRRSAAPPHSKNTLARRQPSLEDLSALVGSGKVTAVVLERGDSLANFALSFSNGRKLPYKQRALLRDTVKRTYSLSGTFGNLEVYLSTR